MLYKDNTGIIFPDSLLTTSEFMVARSQDAGERADG